MTTQKKKKRRKKKKEKENTTTIERERERGWVGSMTTGRGAVSQGWQESSVKIGDDI